MRAKRTRRVETTPEFVTTTAMGYNQVGYPIESPDSSPRSANETMPRTLSEKKVTNVAEAVAKRQPTPTKRPTLSLSKNKVTNVAEAVAKSQLALNGHVLDDTNSLNDTSRYLGRDGHMYIGTSDWKALRELYATPESRGKLVQLLDDIVTENELVPPTREIKRDEAIKSFQQLKALPEGDLLSTHRTESRFNYRQALGLLVVDSNLSGNLCGDYFFQSIRWDCKGGRAGSANESWYDPKSRRAIFHHIIDAEVDTVDRPRLRTHLGTRRFIPTSARPSVSKAIFDLYQPESVLDLSFGWGERMLGWEASKYGKSYYGIDPDKRVIEAGQSMHKLCRQTRKDVQLFCSPAEDFIYEALESEVDMIIFSPPPFNNERYCDEETQAYKRYKNINEFTKDFLEGTLVKAWDSLKVGGTLLLDLGDLKAPQRDSFGNATGGRYRMVDPLLRSLANSLPDMVYRGTIGSGIGRPKADSSFSKVRVDPIWVITKGRCDLARRGLFGSKTLKKLAATT